MNSRVAVPTSQQVKSVVSKAVVWLKTENDAARWWELQTEMVDLCLADISRSGSVNPATAEIHAMLVAMQCRNRSKALHHGIAALGLF